MTTYWITFRISEDRVGGRSYEDRYKALQDAIHKRADLWWADPTSFYAFTSQAEIDALAADFKRAIAPSHDLFLMRVMDTKAAVICGHSTDKDIFKMMPYLRAV